MKIKIGEMQIQNIDYRKLKPLQGNLKDLSKTNYSKLKKSFTEKGLFVPMFVWQEGDVFWLLDGHGRERLFSKEKAVFVDSKGKETFEIPALIIQAKDLKDAKEKILLISSQFQRITQEGFDEFAIDLDSSWLEESVNFDAFPYMQEVKTPEDKAAIEKEEDTPEIPKEPKTKVGDIYFLGQHVLYCEDSTKIENIKFILKNESADIVYTDPPYGIDEKTDRKEHYKTFKSEILAKKGKYEKIIGDDSIETAVKAFNVCLDLKVPILIFWGGNYFSSKMPDSSCWLVWDKKVEDSQRDLNSDCELAYIKHPSKKSVRIFRHLWKGMIKASEQNERRCHPTQKPIALAEWCFNEYAKDSKNVLELFCGSGSTLIACEKTGRKCFAMELSPAYCDVIVERWEKFTGKKAELKRG